MKAQKDSQGYKKQLPLGEKHLVNECAILMLGFSGYVLQHHFVFAPVKKTCVLGSDFLEQWEADINYETRQLMLHVSS